MTPRKHWHSRRCTAYSHGRRFGGVRLCRRHPAVRSSRSIGRGRAPAPLPLKGVAARQGPGQKAEAVRQRSIGSPPICSPAGSEATLSAWHRCYRASGPAVEATSSHWSFAFLKQALRKTCAHGDQRAEQFRRKQKDNEMTAHSAANVFRNLGAAKSRKRRILSGIKPCAAWMSCTGSGSGSQSLSTMRSFSCRTASAA